MSALPDHSPAPIVPEPRKKRWELSPLNKRRLANFKKNRRAVWSFWIFAVLFAISLVSEFLANEKPILVQYRGEYFTPISKFYPETAFGGDFRTEAIYGDPEVQCLIISGGLQDCWDDPDGIMEQAASGVVNGQEIERGFIVWPPIRYRFDTHSNQPGAAPSPPTAVHWLGTDDQKRDVVSRVIYGFRLSVFFAFIVVAVSSVIGIVAGALQGFFGGWLDLIFQRVLEIYGSTPSLYVIIIVVAAMGRSFWLLVILTIIFGWPALVGLVRAEFLRARNFEYVRAARALGVSDWKIMFRHMLPNAMVATLTMLPFIITGAIGTLAGLDFLGFGLPSSSPSLGELTLQAKQNLQAPWLGFTAFITYAVIMSLLVFIFEGVRDAFDPRKTFS